MIWQALKCFVFLVGLLLMVGCAADGMPARCMAPARSEETSLKPRTDADPVAASMTVEAKKIRAGDTFAVSVVLDIAPLYEIGDQQALPPAVATQLEPSLPPGFSPLGEWSAPQPVRSQWPDGHGAYIGRATFSREIRVGGDVEPGEYELACSIQYQACAARYCLAPIEFTLRVLVLVQP